ncbi:MAG: hypothetical protein EB053_02960 [Chlamydiae bacterium]|nr:hypothetical protein [Chlamydiota bacterium]
MFHLKIFYFLVYNPFEISVPFNKNPSFEDYEVAQEELRKIKIYPLLHQLYPNNWGYNTWFTKKRPYPLQDFIWRCSKGIEQNIICKKNSWIPEVHHIRGKNKRDCIVSFCSFNNIYSDLVRTLAQALKEVGFEGGIYYRIGGYPTPTGEELKYCGVPYAFKPLMVEEAFNLGYERVLWLDTSVWPMQKVDDLFEIIEKEGFLFDTGSPNPLGFLPDAKKFLENYCNKKFHKNRKVAGWIMGFKKNDPNVGLFFKEYHDMVRLGYPFMSVNPEEGVLTAILLKLGIRPKDVKKLMITCTHNNLCYVQAREQSVKFIVRSH